MNNTFLLTTNLSSTFNTNWECNIIFNLLTSDGNPGPNNYNENLLKDGSAVAIVFGIDNYNDSNAIWSSAFGVNLFLDNHLNPGGGIKFFKFSPYKQYISIKNSSLDNDIWYSLKVEFVGEGNEKYLNVYLNNSFVINNYLITFDDNLLNGYVGLNVWQGSAIFDQFVCN